MKESIIIQNLKCSGCATSIERSLKAFPEVENVTVDMETAQVDIETAIAGQQEKYARALTNAGYPPVGTENTAGRKVKSYISCAIGKVHHA